MVRFAFFCIFFTRIGIANYNDAMIRNRVAVGFATYDARLVELNWIVGIHSDR